MLRLLCVAVFLHIARGSESPIQQRRTFIRLSFEERIFDRLGNAHNPMFEYDWKMVPRDIEMLNLVPYDPGMCIIDPDNTEVPLPCCAQCTKSYHGTTPLTKWAVTWLLL